MYGFKKMYLYNLEEYNLEIIDFDKTIVQCTL